MCAERNRRRLSTGWTILIFVLVPVSIGAVVGRAVGESREPDEPVYRTSMTVLLGAPFAMDAEQSESAQVSDLYSAAIGTQIAVLRDPAIVVLMVESKIVKAQHRPEYFRGRTTEDITAELTSSIAVVPRPGTRLVDIVVTGPKPDLLPWIARQLWDQFRDTQIVLRSSMLNDRFVRARSRREAAQEALREADQELTTFLAAQNHTLTSLERTVETLLDMEQQLSNELLRIDLGDGEGGAGKGRLRSKLASHRLDVIDRLRAADHALAGALALHADRERHERALRAKEETYESLRRLHDGPFSTCGGIVLQPLMPREPEPQPEPEPGPTLIGAMAGAFLGLLLGFLVAGIRR